MRLIGFVLVLAAVLAAPAASAPAASRVVLAPEADVSLAYFCAWGWEPDECHGDGFGPLRVGGDADRVWRAALRFPLDAVPAAAQVVSARLEVGFDGRCLQVGGGLSPCEGRWLEVAAHALSSAIGATAEPELDPDPLSVEPLWTAWSPESLVLDVTPLVQQWVSGERPNHGVVLRLPDDELAYGGGGVAFASTEDGAVALRPRLEVHYLP